MSYDTFAVFINSSDYHGREKDALLHDIFINRDLFNYKVVKIYEIIDHETIKLVYEDPVRDFLDLFDVATFIRNDYLKEYFITPSIDIKGVPICDQYRDKINNSISIIKTFVAENNILLSYYLYNKYCYRYNLNDKIIESVKIEYVKDDIIPTYFKF